MIITSKEPIIGSGHRGAEFEQKGLRERNLQVLLKALSNKTVQKSIEVLSKIERDEWTAMATTATMLNSFVSLGGTSELITSIKETIKLQIDSTLSPLTNEINQQITDLLNPFLELLTPVINDLGTFFSENAVGTGIGGIAGSIAALYLPGGVIWIALGAILGSIIEDWLSDPFGDVEDTAARGALAIRAWGLSGSYDWRGAINSILDEVSGAPNVLGRIGRIGQLEDF